MRVAFEAVPGGLIMEDVSTVGFTSNKRLVNYEEFVAVVRQLFRSYPGCSDLGLISTLSNQIEREMTGQERVSED